MRKEEVLTLDLESKIRLLGWVIDDLAYIDSKTTKEMLNDKINRINILEAQKA